MTSSDMHHRQHKVSCAVTTRATRDSISTSRKAPIGMNLLDYNVLEACTHGRCDRVD